MRSTAVYENDASLISLPATSAPLARPPPGSLGRLGPGNPGTPDSGTKRKPRVGSAFAASSMAWRIVRSVMHSSKPLLPELSGRTKVKALTPVRSSGIIDLMPLIETEEAARRLARAIASDLSLYNEDKIVSGIQNDNLFDSLAEEIEEGRALYKRRVAPDLYPRNFYDRALVDILIKAKGHIKSKLW